MKLLISIILFSLSIVAYAEEQGHEYIPQFVSLWLKSHDFNDFKIEENKLIIESAGLEISGAIHDMQEKKAGELYLVETRLSIKHNDKLLIEEYVGSLSGNPQEAFVSSIDNLCQTILLPIYAKLLDPTNTRVEINKIKAGERETTFYYSGFGVAGDDIDAEQSRQIEALVLNEIAAMQLDEGLHSAKLVVSKVAEGVPDITLTINGVALEELSPGLKEHAWPSTENYYMGKLFMVLTQS